MVIFFDRCVFFYEKRLDIRFENCAHFLCKLLKREIFPFVMQNRSKLSTNISTVFVDIEGWYSGLSPFVLKNYPLLSITLGVCQYVDDSLLCYLLKIPLDFRRGQIV